MNTPTSADLPTSDGGPNPAILQADAAGPPKTASADSDSGSVVAPTSRVEGDRKERRPHTVSERSEAPSKLDRQPEAKNYHLYGTFNNTSFDSARYTEPRVTWAMALQRIDRGDYAAEADAPDPVFDAACAVWAAQRIIVLRHQQGALDRAEHLLRRLSYWASGHDIALKLMGASNDVVLPLGDLAADEAWPADSDGALVLVQRRQDPKTTLFLSSNNGVGVKALRERLQARNSRLLISVAADWDAGEGRLDPFDKSVKTLEVGDRAPGACASDDESPFDAVPRIVASLFEGLGVQEFQSLVNDLLVGISVPTATPTLTEASVSAPPTKPTRHQRWLTGDIDRVLAELGVRYVVATAESGSLPGQARSVGYYLADPISPYTEFGWVIAHHPALLGHRADSLLDRYLIDDTASTRYHEAFLGMLARLDTAGVRTVSVDWLLGAWQRALTHQAHPGWIGERLFALVEYLSSDSRDAEPRLAVQMIDTLAADVITSELKFQRELGLQPLRELFPPAAPDGHGHPEPQEVWRRLRAKSSADRVISVLEYRQITSLWALLLLARRWPRAVAVALARVLDKTSEATTLWRQAAAELPVLQSVARHAALALHYLLALTASEVPAVWTAVAGGVVQAFKDDMQVSVAPVGARRTMPVASRERIVQGQRLAFLCIYALAPQIETEEPSGCVLWLLNLLPQTERRPAGDGDLIGRLLAMAHLAADEQPMLGPAGAGTLPAADIVRFLRAIALALQHVKHVTAQQTADALLVIATGLRAMLPVQQRRALVNQVRNSLESQQLTRDAFEAEDSLEMVRLMRRRIRATQLVLRSLSAG